ncbi:hypothetical protein [Amycolatopsis magusensis]|uniref:Uncharacterized protein n=1 Tax=Amycolatopsis magusensis TaxID=882444 RepID=A0ABS4PT40_9PSEU|nr:hypothetical protein [Amycolatopsis magusensis]MBP2182592.1 hypothetical protein [Amycolatopsis magusensis]MDI5982430.1 hypothetical protein [Amycolatopsis magusensis]
MKRLTARILVLAALAFAALSPSVASAQPGAGWTRYGDFGSSYLCQAAGMAGELAGQWHPGEWMCVQGALMVRNPAAPAAPLPG